MENNVCKILGFDFNCIYVDDYKKALEFYTRYFGFKKKFDMSETSCWGMAGEVGMFIEGGNSMTEITPETVRSSVIYRIDDAHKLFQTMKNDGVKIFQKEPEDMGQGYWFQFCDPAGNILEVLSYKSDEPEN